MALAADVKKEAINKYRVHKHDTGSPEVQVALLSQRILELTEHLKTHQKDHSSRRGLLTLVSRRRRLVKYLLAHDPERHKKLLASLGLRR